MTLTVHVSLNQNGSLFITSQAQIQDIELLLSLSYTHSIYILLNTINHSKTLLMDRQRACFRSGPCQRARGSPIHGILILLPWLYIRFDLNLPTPFTWSYIYVYRYINIQTASHTSLWAISLV